MAHKYIPLALTAALALASYSHGSAAATGDGDDCCGDAWRDGNDRVVKGKNLAERKPAGESSLQVNRVLLAGAV